MSMIIIITNNTKSGGSIEKEIESVKVLMARIADELEDTNLYITGLLVDDNHEAVKIDPEKVKHTFIINTKDKIMQEWK